MDWAICLTFRHVTLRNAFPQSQRLSRLLLPWIPIQRSLLQSAILLPSQMTLISQQIRRKGTLTLPGSYSSKKVVEDLLLKDAQEHHCFFNASGFHNHLSHQYVLIWIICPILIPFSLLAAYDLGASATLLQKIYENEAKIQRPILLSDTDKQIVITADNWTQYIGNRK